MLIVLALAKPSVKYEELANIVAVLDARRSRHQTDRRLLSPASRRNKSGNASSRSSCVPSKKFQVQGRAGELQAGKSDASAPSADARVCTHRIASSSSRLFAAGRRQPACCTPPASGESPCLAGRRYSIRTFPLLLVRARARHNGAGGRGPDTRHQVHQYCLHVMPADVLAWPGLCSAGASHWPDLHVGR